MTNSRDDEFNEFVHAHFVDLCRTGFLICGDRHKAEDATQEALLRVASKWPRITDRLAYVRRAMINAIIDETRRPWRRERSVDQGLDGAGTDTLHRVDDRDELSRALAQLTPRQRACVVLRHYRDLSISDTATALGISEGNVKRTTADGLRVLKDHLVPSESMRS